MVPFLKKNIFLIGWLPIAACLATSSPFSSGFHIPDSIAEVTLKYKNIRNLILLPVRINDTLEINLIVDTGTRNVVLFGKRFQKYFDFLPDKQVQFSGLGSGKPVLGRLAINNKLVIGSAVTHDIPVVVVASKNLFGEYVNVHGVIGYQLFLDFEVEINPTKREITLRPAKTSTRDHFSIIPLRLVDTKPVLDCTFITIEGNLKICDLMIDTGSNLSLLLKTTDAGLFNSDIPTKILGRGFNGNVEGIEIKTDRLQLKGMEIRSVPTGVMLSAYHNHASIGMGIL